MISEAGVKFKIYFINSLFDEVDVLMILNIKNVNLMELKLKQQVFDYPV